MEGANRGKWILAGVGLIILLGTAFFWSRQKNQPLEAQATPVDRANLPVQAPILANGSKLSEEEAAARRKQRQDIPALTRRLQAVSRPIDRATREISNDLAQALSLTQVEHTRLNAVLSSAWKSILQHQDKQAQMHVDEKGNEVYRVPPYPESAAIEDRTKRGMEEAIGKEKADLLPLKLGTFGFYFHFWGRYTAEIWTENKEDGTVMVHTKHYNDKGEEVMKVPPHPMNDETREVFLSDWPILNRKK